MRPRRALLGASLILVLLTVAGGCGGAVGTTSARTTLKAPPPIVALNCPVGNAYRCDRLIFEVRLPLPARHLEAWVAGRPVHGLRTLPVAGGGPRHGAAGLAWSGHVQPAGLVEPGGPIEIRSRRPNYWAGSPPVHARVRVRAELRRGGPLSEVFPSIELLPGFG